MRADQIERLEALAEELTDVFLEEADPRNWPGYGMNPNEMDPQTRGNRVWVKKDAAATLVVIMKTTSLVAVGRTERAPRPGEGDGSDIDTEVKAAEKEAAAAIERINKRAAERG